MPMSGDSGDRRYDIVADTRRRWSKAEKVAIVAEASVPDVNVSAIARRHGIAPSLLFRWREQFAHTLKGGAERPICDPGPSFVPVALPAPTAISEQPSSTVEITLRNGRRVRVRATIDTTALKRIVDALEDR